MRSADAAVAQAPDVTIAACSPDEQAAWQSMRSASIAKTGSPPVNVTRWRPARANLGNSLAQRAAVSLHTVPPLTFGPLEVMQWAHDNGQRRVREKMMVVHAIRCNASNSSPVPLPDSAIEVELAIGTSSRGDHL
jgi:hypothetical protein